MGYMFKQSVLIAQALACSETISDFECSQKTTLMNVRIYKKAKKGNKYNATLYPNLYTVVSDHIQNCTTTELQTEIAFLLENCFKSLKNN